MRSLATSGVYPRPLSLCADGGLGSPAEFVFFPVALRALNTMMTLRGFCLVLTTVLLSHFAEQGSATADRSSVSYVIGYCVIFSLLGKACAVATSLRYPAGHSAGAWSYFEVRRTLVEWLWVGALPWVMATSGWTRSLAYLHHLDWPHAPVLVLWFAPSLVVLLALDLSAAQLDQYLCETEPTTGLRGGKTSRGSSDRAQPSLMKRWFARVRLGGTGAIIMCLVPVLLVVGCIDALNYVAPAVSPGARALAAVGFLVAVCFILSPVWMRAWMGATPFPGDSSVQQTVSTFCSRLRINSPSVLCVSGDQAWHGAALVGWAPPIQQLWIGAAVVRQLPADELDMVILHELAHLRRGHCWWRIGALLLCGGCILGAMAGGWIGWQAAADDVSLWHLWLERGSLVTFAGAIVLVLSWVSRRCELDADSEACRQATQVCSWAADRPDRAAAALVRALLRMDGTDGNRRRRYWLHPSLAERQQALESRYHFELGAGEPAK